MRTAAAQVRSSPEMASWELFGYIGVFYNRQRNRSTDDCLAPFVYEQKSARAAQKVSGNVLLCKGSGGHKNTTTFRSS